MKRLNTFGDFKVIQEEKKWIQKAKLKKGALRKSLGVPKGEVIPISTINAKIETLNAKKEKGEELTKKESKLLKRLNLAKTLKTKVEK